MPDFFEAVKRGLERGVNTVGVKSREMLGTTQLRSQIKALQDEKRRGLEELGNIVYTLHRQGKLDGESDLARARCSALATLDQKIQSKEDEIRRIQLETQEALGKGAVAPLGYCECGASIFEAARFCGSCGRSVEDTLSRIPAEMRCPQCGDLLAAEARFCGGCGQRMGTGNP